MPQQMVTWRESRCWSGPECQWAANARRPSLPSGSSARPHSLVACRPTPGPPRAGGLRFTPQLSTTAPTRSTHCSDAEQTSRQPTSSSALRCTWRRPVTPGQPLLTWCTLVRRLKPRTSTARLPCTPRQQGTPPTPSESCSSEEQRPKQDSTRADARRCTQLRWRGQAQQSRHWSRAGRRWRPQTTSASRRFFCRRSLGSLLRSRLWWRQAQT
mmetsp:Transcript_26772/g.53784  ORF Transcript_26772/g.53784 Transcript_26772/m.53784 type:complete len:213 (-) Transcript_26772:169-807(-)